MPARSRLHFAPSSLSAQASTWHSGSILQINSEKRVIQTAENEGACGVCWQWVQTARAGSIIRICVKLIIFAKLTPHFFCRNGSRRSNRTAGSRRQAGVTTFLKLHFAASLLKKSTGLRKRIGWGTKSCFALACISRMSVMGTDPRRWLVFVLWKSRRRQDSHS
jgi:hypothetical protein